MNREQGLKLVQNKVSEGNLIKHMKAVEAAMKELARHFNEDQTEWGLAGLLHDLDYEQTKDNPDQHGLLTVQMLEDYDLSPKQLDAIRAHASQKEPENAMERSIYAADPLTGLIVAGALVHPEGLQGVDSEFVLNRMGENNFAQSVDREAIRSCQELEMKVDEFIDVVLAGMKKIDDELEL